MTKQEQPDDILDTPYFESRFRHVDVHRIVGHMGTHIWSFILACCLLSVFIAFIVNMFKANPQQWFRDAIPDTDSLVDWNISYIDENLHKLSRWDMLSAQEWKNLVRYTYQPFDIPNNTRINYLEVGVGVGAWSRIFLQDFPLAAGEGIDLEEKAIRIAQLVLPEHRISVQVLDMYYIPDGFYLQQFDYIFFPAVLCYASALSEVYYILQGIVQHNVLKLGGNVSITFLPLDLNAQGNCVTVIPKDFWYKLKGYHVLSMQDIDDWHILNTHGQYAVFLTRQA
jgi:hypothetical protein